MSQPLPRGIDRSGLDAAFEADEAHKSNLILQARLLRDQNQDEPAARNFAEVAEIEERLSDHCAERGLLQKSFVHRFSAASCWAQAGNFFQAIAICDELLACGELPDQQRLDIEQYAETLRRRRAQLYADLALAGTTGSDG